MGGESIANVLFTVSFASFVAAAIFGILAVVLFIRFRIPSVIGDLSGRNARKSIEEMRLHNEKSGKKTNRPGAKGKKNDKKNDKKAEKTKAKANTGDAAGMNSDHRAETGLLEENKKRGYDPGSTALLNEEEATGVLENKETAPLGGNETAALRKAPSIKLRMIDEVVIVHSDEDLHGLDLD